MHSFVIKKQFEIKLNGVGNYWNLFLDASPDIAVQPPRDCFVFYLSQYHGDKRLSLVVALLTSNYEGFEWRFGWSIFRNNTRNRYPHIFLSGKCRCMFENRTVACFLVLSKQSLSWLAIITKPTLHYLWSLVDEQSEQLVPLIFSGTTCRRAESHYCQITR